MAQRIVVAHDAATVEQMSSDRSTQPTSRTGGPSHNPMDENFLNAIVANQANHQSGKIRGQRAIRSLPDPGLPRVLTRYSECTTLYGLTQQTNGMNQQTTAPNGELLGDRPCECANRTA